MVLEPPQPVKCQADESGTNRTSTDIEVHNTLGNLPCPRVALTRPGYPGPNTTLVTRSRVQQTCVDIKSRIAYPCLPICGSEYVHSSVVEQYQATTRRQHSYEMHLSIACNTGRVTVWENGADNGL